MHASVRHILCTIFCLLLALPAYAAPSREAQAKALDALTLDFTRYGVTSSRKVIAQKYLVACDAGHTTSCMYERWRTAGVPSLSLAAEAMQPACEDGDSVACLVVAWNAIDNPVGNDPSDTLVRAARSLRGLCDAGLQGACYEFGMILYRNLGVKADPITATYRWEPACNKGHGPSCAALANAFQVGDRVRQDTKKARSFADFGCNLRFPEACFQLGRLNRSDWSNEETDKWFGRLCEDGHPESCTLLAQRYVRGEAPEPVAGRIIDLFVTACNLNNANACYESARSYQTGPEADLALAFSFFRSACEAGDVRGCTGVVDMIESKQSGSDVKTDQLSYERACSVRNHPPACQRLGLELASGQDLPKDLPRARTLLAQVCNGDQSPAIACLSLGSLWENGLGGQRDRTIASDYYKWACRQGAHEACKLRGDLLHNGVGVQRNDHEAAEMFALACGGGFAGGCTAGGQLFDQATLVTRDVSKAVELYSKGCDGGDAAGCVGRGVMLEEGIAGSKDWEGAREAFERAVAFGSVEAHRMLAYVLFNGKGGKKDKKRARELCSAGCKSGDRIACKGAEFMTPER